MTQWCNLRHCSLAEERSLHTAACGSSTVYTPPQSWPAQQTSPHAPLHGAATCRISRHDHAAKIDLFWQFDDHGSNHNVTWLQSHTHCNRVVQVMKHQLTSHQQATTTAHLWFSLLLLVCMSWTITGLTLYKCCIVNRQIGVGDSKSVVYFDPLLLQVQKIELLRDCKRTPSKTKWNKHITPTAPHEWWL